MQERLPAILGVFVALTFMAPVLCEAACISGKCHVAMSRGASLHPKEEACEKCHVKVSDVHPEKEAKSFRLEVGKLCIDCHDDLTQHTNVHVPVREGKCTACHNPHGKKSDKLLVEEYSAMPFVDYTDKSYPLCFRCHKRNLLRFPDTSFSTGFRDGERNLHYLHVNKRKRGKNCIMCHEIHGGSLPKLMVDKVPFGSWRMPLHFTKTETGGSCSPGCHKTYGYDRNKGK